MAEELLQKQRRLAAIMFTDMVGYSALLTCSPQTLPLRS